MAQEATAVAWNDAATDGLVSARGLTKRFGQQCGADLRTVYRARKEDCRTCTLARDCLGPHAAGDQPRRVSTVRKRVAQVGSGGAALVHEITPPEGPSGEYEVIWCDVPASRIRRTYIAQLRRQQVTIVTLPGASGPLHDSEVPRLWTRAERAHRRLSWAARLIRNRADTDVPRYAYTVFGVLPTLAVFLGLSPDSP